LSARPLGVGVVGLGVMGRTHLQAWQDAAREGLGCRVVAACDRKGPGAAGASGDPAGNLEAQAGAALFIGKNVQLVDDVQALLWNAEVELVSICTPTDTHVELARRALEAGKHVLVEKPVALDAAEIEALARAARRAERLCMPAFCMRFWPGWDWLKERVAGATFGPVRSAVFQRLASPPHWSQHFYRDAARSGGALSDLHVHDVDFVRWCFGEPDGVQSRGSLDHVTTLYRFERGPRHVVAEGGWDHASGWPFQMRFTVAFDQATADYALGREHALVLYRGGRSEPVPLARHTGYDGEVRHFLECVRVGAAPRATLADAAAVARLLERERAALDA
jgi:predicted dehydrogenase